MFRIIVTRGTSKAYLMAMPLSVLKSQKWYFFLKLGMQTQLKNFGLGWMTTVGGIDGQTNKQKKNKLHYLSIL